MTWLLRGALTSRSLAPRIFLPCGHRLPYSDPMLTLNSSLYYLAFNSMASGCFSPVQHAWWFPCWLHVSRHAFTLVLPAPRRTAVQAASPYKVSWEFEGFQLGVCKAVTCNSKTGLVGVLDMANDFCWEVGVILRAGV